MAAYDPYEGVRNWRCRQQGEVLRRGVQTSHKLPVIQEAHFVFTIFIFPGDTWTQ